MAGVLTEIAVAGRLAGKVLARRLRGEMEASPDLEAFSLGINDILDRAPAGLINEHAWLRVPANEPPWVTSDINLALGDQVSCFSEGRVYVNTLLDIRCPLSLQIWSKVGDGDIFRGTQNSHSFVSSDEGNLQFGNYFPNDWETPQGARQQDDTVYASASGESLILIIHWAVPALEGLQSLLEVGDYNSRFQDEISRIERGSTTPEGWDYLWHIGPADIYQEGKTGEGNACIHCKTHGDTGILQKKVDLPLLENSEVSWRWCVDQLPSPLREDTLPTHDYLSIAVEFENGRDITYYWSSKLAVGTGYDCPLPNWRGKEYHVAIRSGTDGLGEWQSERRNLYDDYKQYMGEPPARIVKIWLIANSIFQRNTGVCDYTDILLHDGDEITRVL
ncbi:MAG: hypothetical protein ACJAUG_001044 [Halioglobus sp.]|jgi:hypothetical protein